MKGNWVRNAESKVERKYKTKLWTHGDEKGQGMCEERTKTATVPVDRVSARSKQKRMLWWQG